LFFTLCLVAEMMFFWINRPYDAEVGLPEDLARPFSGDEEPFGGAHGWIDWPLVNVFRLAVLGGDFVISEDTAWDTNMMFIVFTILFNIILLNLLIAILSDIWATIQSRQHLYYLRNLARIINDEDKKHESWRKRCASVAAGLPKKRFIHLVEPAAEIYAEPEAGSVEEDLREKVERSMQAAENAEKKVDAMADDMREMREMLGVLVKRHSVPPPSPRGRGLESLSSPIPR